MFLHPAHMNILKVSSAALLLLAFVEGLHARGALDDYFIPKCTFSPNHRYGVSVWDYDDAMALEKADDHKAGQSGNQVIELATGRVVTTMNAQGASRRSYGGRVPGSATFWNTIAQPRWSADSSLLLWKVNGKWGPQALVLVWPRKDLPPCQIDVLEIARQAILTRTRKARPQQYREVKKEYGKFGVDGFAVDVHTDGEGGKSVSLPLVMHADLICSPNLALPNALTSQLDGVIHEDGTLVVKRFQLGRRDNANF